jgi:hypothetical protein
MTLMNPPTPAHGIALSPEDLAFDRAFREAAKRELEAREPTEELPRPRPAFDTEQLMARRAGFRVLVIWVVGIAAAMTAVAMMIGIARALF